MNTTSLKTSLPALGVVATLALGAGLLLDRPSTATPAPVGGDLARQLSSAFRDVAKHIRPSVVGIVAKRGRALDGNELERLHGNLPLPFGDDLRRFFGDGTPMPQPQGQGTGVIVDSDGIIATNNHVVRDASEIEVHLADGRTLAAEVIGTDPETDLALLRVEGKDLPAARLGDSTRMEPGDWVVAVGNPFGLDHTVTVGVVSATGRSGIGVADFENFIQTDAAINPGNSGGPLLNLDGEVIGINTAIRSSNGGSDGISFAIPSATLADVMPDLVDGGRVKRGWLGVGIQPLTEALAESFDAPGAKGALVSRVYDDTPAAEGGLRAGDIISHVNGKPIEDSRGLSETIAALDPGQEAKLGVWRDGKQLELSIELATRPEREELAGARPLLERRSRDDFGLGLQDLSRADQRTLGIDGGVRVTRVQAGSPAAAAGLTSGDVILSIGSEEVRSADEAAELLRASGEDVRLLVQGEDGGTRWIVLERRAGR